MNEMMTQFLRLITYPPNMFQCCRNPKVVCVDGIVLSVENEKILNRRFNKPWINEEEVLSTRFSTRPQRQIIVLKKEEKRILKLFLDAGISVQEMVSLKSAHPTSDVIHFMDLTRVLRRGKYVSDPLLGDFFHSLYKTVCPVISLVPSRIWNHIQEILDKKDIVKNEQTLVDYYSPVMGKFLLYLLKKREHQEIVSSGFKVLEELLKKAKKTYSPQFKKWQDPHEEITNPRNRTTVNEYLEEVFESGTFFPGRPAIRTIKKIRMAKEKQCSKKHKAPGALGAGTLLFWCAEHRFCLGFVVLDASESITQVAEVFISRFKTQPPVIIYDNGCNLSEYILNRNPLLFLATLILSDGFHWRNHKNCSIPFNSREYTFLDCKLYII